MVMTSGFSRGIEKLDYMAELQSELNTTRFESTISQRLDELEVRILSLLFLLPCSFDEDLYFPPFLLFLMIFFVENSDRCWVEV